MTVAPVTAAGPLLVTTIVQVTTDPGVTAAPPLDFTIDRSATSVETVIGADAGGALPPPVCRPPVVLTTVPGVDDVTVTTIVQPPGGIGEPDAIVIVVGVTVTPVQVPVFADVVVTPAGMVSVNGAVSASAVALALPSDSVSVAVPPGTIVAGVKLLASVGGVAPPPPVLTVNGALAAGAVPAFVSRPLVRW